MGGRAVKMVKEVLPDGNSAVFVCPQCGKEFKGFFMVELFDMYDKSICPACIRIENEKVRNQKATEKKQALLASVNDRMASAGFKGVLSTLEAPFTRHNAEFIWRHKDNHLVISGETGVGKTTSAAFVIRLLMKERKLKVKYCNFSEFHAEYVKAKINEQGFSETKFWERINNLDYLVIDELAWRKGANKLTGVAQELLFEIINGAYLQSRKCRVWLMGNMYNNAFEHLLDQPEPVLRRLQHSFTPVWFDRKAQPKLLGIYEEKI
jgi:DNA replication protein DnaC